MRQNPSQATVRAFRRAARAKRLWLLIPKKRNLYVPGIEGSFYEAFEAAQTRANSNRSQYEVWETDPVRYRTSGGLLKKWATAKPH